MRVFSEVSRSPSTPSTDWGRLWLSRRGSMSCVCLGPWTKRGAASQQASERRRCRRPAKGASEMQTSRNRGFDASPDTEASPRQTLSSRTSEHGQELAQWPPQRCRIGPWAPAGQAGQDETGANHVGAYSVSTFPPPTNHHTSRSHFVERMSTTAAG